MRRRDVFIGSLEDGKTEALALFFKDSVTGDYAFLLVGSKWYVFDTIDEVDAFIDILTEIRNKMMEEGG